MKRIGLPYQNPNIRRKRRAKNHNCWQTFRSSGAVVEYPASICWRCIGCTACCQDTSTHERRVRMLPEEVSRICLETGLEWKAFSIPFTNFLPYTHEMRKSHERCFFLHEGKCSIYDNRPITCVFYPFFLNRIDDAFLRFELTPEKCKGLGLGTKMPEAFFRRLFKLAVQRLDLAGGIWFYNRATKS